MASRRILVSAMTALLASVPLALAPAPTHGQGNGQTPPVGHFRALKVDGTSTPPNKTRRHQTVLPARAADPAALKAAKVRAEGKPKALLAASPCTSVTQIASPASPQSPGTTVAFTATATGCASPTYEFWLQPPGGSWAVVQAYSAGNSWTWNTAGLAAGSYNQSVRARDATSTAAYDTNLAATYVLSAAATCTAVTESASPASPQSPGTSVTFTATATGCANPTFEFWLQPPGGSWAVVRAYSSSNSWTWNTTGLAAGTYNQSVRARDASSTAAYDTNLAATYVLSAAATCTAVTESASPVSPQSPGTAVTFTATATGCANPAYEFWLQPPGGSWAVVQAYSAGNSWTWNTAGLAAGTYNQSVRARDASSTAAYDTNLAATYVLSAAPPCSGVTETASPPSPQQPGTMVTFTATATGCPNPRYEFWLQAPAGAWAIVQAYSSSNTLAWNTTGLAPGTYTESVHVRDATSSANYDAALSPPATYVLNAGPACTSVSETAIPASPQAPGTSVKFTATSIGCPNPTYEFWLLAPGAGWAVTQAYGTANTWTWSTTGLAAGTYTLNVYVRQNGSTADPEASLSPTTTYLLQIPTCTSVTQTAAPASPQLPGTSVMFTATASGCANPTYEFWLQPPGGAWAVQQGYSPNNTWSWNTTGLALGTYSVSVRARDASSTAAYDTYLSPTQSYVLSAGPACTSVTQTANPASPQPPGTAVTFTATASGCPAPTYEFWLLAPGGSWTVMQPYGSSNKWTWNTTGLAGGIYQLNTYVRQSGSTATYEAYLSPTPTYRIAPGWHGTDAAGVSAADEGFCCVPPDTTGAIGPQNYVEAINTTIAVYDRDLNLVASSDLGSFSGAGALNVSDPQIQWDPRSGRWLYTLVGFDNSITTTEILVGWSRTADPTDLANGWCRFNVPSGSMLPDYPKLGHDDNFILIGANIYDMSQSSQPFVTAQIYALTKPAAGDTSCAAPTVFYFADSHHVLKNADGSLAFTPVPANTSDASQGGFVVAAHSPTLAPVGPQTKVMAWHVSRQPSGNPALNTDGDLTVNSFDVPAGVPQPDGAPLIDSLDARLTQAVAHADPNAGGAEAVWTQQTIDGPGGRSVVRWYELLPATLTVRQQGQVAHPTDFVFNGAISPSISGNDAVVIYNRGGASESPLVAGQGHSAGAALGALDSGETILATSTGVDTDFSCSAPYGPPCRWGDYAGASPDPLNAGVVWATEEWYDSSFFGFPGWGTQNFALAT